MTEPLPFPENFDPQTYMIANVTENGVFHESRKGAAFAARLVANGTQQDVALAERVLEVVLGCQERRAGDPHHGNFLWMLEDDVVQDLNAVEFNLEHLIPMMLQHSDRLSPDLQVRVLEAVRLGLEEIRRLDVLVVYVEAAERSAYPDGWAFARAVASGALTDVTAPPFTYRAEGERLWTVEYARDGQKSGIEIDLMAWALKRRWTREGDLDWPMLQSPMAQETKSGHIAIGGATLTCGPQAAWLFASPATGRWVAGYHGLQSAPLTLTVPAGSIEIAAMGTGTLVWDNGRVTVEAVELRGESIIR